MVTLVSDFGLAYPTATKGVILSRTDGQLVDAAHDLPRQDTHVAAFWLHETLPYFLPAVHLVVADPGVGTDRRAVVLRAGDHVFVGPDNGVLRPLARCVAAEFDDNAPIEAYEIDVPNPESTTLRGWDMLALATADVHVADAPALGSVDRFEPIPVGSLPECRLSEATASDDGREATGEVFVVGDFGNCITNVPGAFVRDAAGETVWVNGESIPVGRTFEAVARGGKLVVIGSHGNVECDVNHGRGNEALGLTLGDRVELRVD